MDRWMVGWTRPNAEFDVAERLRDIGLAAFVPAIRRQRPVKNWSRNRGQGKERYEIILSAAFPRYMLFTATAIEPVWQKAIRVDGMTLVVRKPGDRVEPGVLPPAVVAMLRGPNGDGVIKDLVKTVKAIERYAKDTHVAIIDGPFTGYPGTVAGDDGRNIRVIVSLFGRDTESLFPRESIQAA